jgi:hypothetical protein
VLRGVLSIVGHASTVAACVLSSTVAPVPASSASSGTAPKPGVAPYSRGMRSNEETE